MLFRSWEPASDDHYFMVSERWKEYQDSQGRFQLHLKPGEQTLRIRARGFGESNQIVMVPAGGVLDGVRVALRPARSLRGVVIEESSGAPVAGARLYLGALPSESRRVTAAIAYADNAGRFTIADVGSEDQLVSATHPEFAPAWMRVPENASDVTLYLSEGVTVGGSVSLGGAPVEGAHVHVIAPGFSESSLSSASTDAHGRFTLGRVPPQGVHYYATLSPPQIGRAHV